MALVITNGGNGSNLQLASGVYANIPSFDSNWNTDFEVQAYLISAGTNNVFTILGNSASGGNDPRLTLDTGSGQARIRNSGVERTATFTGIDLDNALGFQLRAYRSSGKINFRIQELTQTDIDSMATNANGLPTLDGNGNPTGGGSADYQFSGSFNGNFIVDRAFDSAAATNQNFGEAYFVRIKRGGLGSVDRIYNFTRTSGTVIPDVNGGSDSTLVGATKTYAPQYTFGDNITFATGLTGLTGAYIEDTQGNQFNLTGVTDTDADVPALIANLDACLLEIGTLNVTDGVSTETANIEPIAPSGFVTTTLDSLPPVELATNWTFGFDTPAAVGDQSFENSAIITHNTDGTITWTPQALSYTYYTIDATDGTVSEVTKAFNSEGDLVTDGYVKSIVKTNYVNSIVRSITNG